MFNAIDIIDGSVLRNNRVPASNSKGTKFPELFYSPDYKKLFDKEIEEISLELLSTAESILSNYNFKTIDYLNEFRPTFTYDSFGNLISVTSNEEQQLVSRQISPEIADKISNIVATTISPLKDAISPKPGTAYSAVLKNYGYHTSSADIISYKPGYSSTGIPYYDLEVAVADIDGVIGYNIYMIEEVE